MLREYYCNLYCRENTVPTEAPKTKIPDTAWHNELSRDMDKPFTNDEVESVIKHLKNNRACGPDLVRNEHLKVALPLIPMLTSLFNRCLTEGSIPAAWLDAHLKIIPKGKGSILEPSSYRGIAKKSCIYKVLSSPVSSRLQTILTLRDILPESQYGFRRRLSTIDACAKLHADIKLSEGKRTPLYAVFIDMKSAFDLAPRQKVLEKLAKHGIGQSLINLLTAMLQANRVFIDDGLKLLEDITQTSGYPQGDNISPLLYITLTSDLPELLKGEFPEVRILMYADDIVIYSRCRRDLRKALDFIGEYCESNGLAMNERKTKAMKIQRGRKITQAETFRIGNDKIEYVQSYPYLGIEFMAK